MYMQTTSHPHRACIQDESLFHLFFVFGHLACIQDESLFDLYRRVKEAHDGVPMSQELSRCPRWASSYSEERPIYVQVGLRENYQQIFAASPRHSCAEQGINSDCVICVSGTPLRVEVRHAGHSQANGVYAISDEDCEGRPIWFCPSQNASLRWSEATTSWVIEVEGATLYHAPGCRGVGFPLCATWHCFDVTEQCGGEIPTVVIASAL